MSGAKRKIILSNSILTSPHDITHYHHSLQECGGSFARKKEIVYLMSSGSIYHRQVVLECVECYTVLFLATNVNYI